MAVLHVADKDAIFDQGVFCAGRAFVVNGDRAATVGDGAVIKDGDAFGGDLFAHEVGKRGRAFAVEVAFKAVADGFVQQDAGPSGAQGDVHDACRGGNGLEVDESDTQGFSRGGFPVVGVDEAGQRVTPAAAGVAAFATTVFLDDDRHVEAGHRAGVGDGVAFGAQNHHFLNGGSKGCGDLNHAFIQGAGIGVDLTKCFDLDGKFRIRHRIRVTVELLICRVRGLSEGAAAVSDSQTRGIDGALQGVFGDLGRVSISSGFALYSAQTKALSCVITGVFEPSVVEGQHFRAAAFQEQFAVISPCDSLAQHCKRAGLVKQSLEWAEGGCLGHFLSFSRGHRRLNAATQCLVP